MNTIAVKLRKGDEIIFCKPKDTKLDFLRGEQLIIKNQLGLEDGQVEFEEKDGKKIEIIGEIVRKATKEDLEKIEKIKAEEKADTRMFIEKILQYGLPMKHAQTHLSFDEKRLTFFFTAEGRVDFRDLVKDLVSTFRKLIRLQQIGPRDDARLRGGFGPCGRSLCCQSFLTKIESVTMERAREQKLNTVASSKISGLCGKLMCCLAFEEKLYEELRKKMPEIGTKVKTPAGEKGRVIGQNVLMGKVLVELTNGTKTEIKLKE